MSAPAVPSDPQPPFDTLGDLLVELLSQVTALRAEVCQLRQKVKELQYSVPV